MDVLPVMQLFIDYWQFWVAGIMVLAALLLMRMYAPTGKLPYRPRGRLVTKSELRFYKSLIKASQDDFEIFAMVRMADLLRVEDGVRNKRIWINKILAKHVDFVLCDPGSLEPVLCIELDDRTHERSERMERDQFVDSAFESAGLPLLRIAVQRNYPPREIRELIDDVI